MLLKDWREHHQLSYRECARLFGLKSPSSVQKIERGTTWPNAETAFRIVSVTNHWRCRPGVSFAELVDTWIGASLIPARRLRIIKASERVVMAK